VDRLTGGVQIWRRENPFYDRHERRSGGWFGVSGRIAGPVRAGVRGALEDVGFDTLDERLSSYGGEVSLDTRHDPVFPRNAVYARAGWEALRPAVSLDANRRTAEARGYLGLLGQSVLSLRWQYSGADEPLPLYERALLGGAGTVRGYRLGVESGDNLMAVSAEVRVPLSSPLGISRAGVSVFADRGKVWDHGRPMRDSPWRTGGGVGFFFLASLLQLNADVAVRQGGGARLHVSTGLQF
jgi:outer membrane protein assembly factor BamA